MDEIRELDAVAQRPWSPPRSGQDIDISLRQLEYLVAVADLLGFRRAAEHCHVSQPALSAQIQQLEAVLGVKLFERDSRQVMLTPAGRELVARARRVLTEAEDILKAAERMGDPFAGPLHLGAIPTVAPYVLPEVVPVLVKRYPKLQRLPGTPWSARSRSSCATWTTRTSSSSRTGIASAAKRWRCARAWERMRWTSGPRA
ncbi:LysR family transcriptional regulator [Stigmatella aurantiaca]|uniref:LysR family transcriptional regulator n=1 Tax=Stigmatella aurantiaca TaxID=41 RepID=UPI0022B6D6F5|nr:LysR family transcriptional regulator [Stigmatella aurantiaca]